MPARRVVEDAPSRRVREPGAALGERGEICGHEQRLARHVEADGDERRRTFAGEGANTNRAASASRQTINSAAGVTLPASP
ncbi:MAG: hypothetical protein ABSC25_26950 [Roseiarcus sp.]